jgi:hypothetical protein
MTKAFLLSLAIGSLVTTDAAAQPHAARAGEVRVPAVAVAPARPVHAALRYNATMTSACRSFSDTSSEVCLLLALHVIRLSQNPLPTNAM